MAIKNGNHQRNELLRIALSFAHLLVAVAASGLSVTYSGMRFPAQAPPLPDISLLHLPNVAWGFEMSEYIIRTMFCGMVIVFLVHTNRTTVLIRFFNLFAVVYLLRSLMLLATSFPETDAHVLCKSRQQFNSTSELFAKMVRVVWTSGMASRGGRTCGDYMYSGHSASLTTLALFLSEYVDSALVRLAAFSMCISGLVLILLSHEHYTVDVIVGVFVPLMLFVLYHNSVVRLHSYSSGYRMRIYLLMPYLLLDSAADTQVHNRLQSPMELARAVFSYVRLRGRGESKHGIV